MAVCDICKKPHEIEWRLTTLEKDFEYMRKLLIGTFIASLTSLAVLLINLYFKS